MMKHLQSIRALALFGALILLIAVPTSAHASASFALTKISGPSVFASFEYDQGTVHTIVAVGAANNTILEPPRPGGPESARSLLVAIFRTQGDTVLLDASGVTDTFQLAVANDLGTARLIANMLLRDEVTGTDFSAAVDLSWAATADLIRQKFNSSTVIPGEFVVTTHFEGSSRDAVASGSITALSSNFTPVPSTVGQIAQAKTGAVAVQIGP